MARELSEINVSGELLDIRLGGAGPEKSVPTVEQLGNDTLADISVTGNINADTDITAGGVVTAPDVTASLILRVQQDMQVSTPEVGRNLPYLRVGTNGLVYFYYPPTTDVTWIDTDGTDIILTTSPSANIFNLVIDEDIPIDGGEWAIALNVENTNNNSRIITVDVYSSGGLLGSKTSSVGGTSTQLMGFNGFVTGAQTSGESYYCQVTASDTGCTIKGTNVLSEIGIVKYGDAVGALQAQVNQVEADSVIVITSAAPLGINPSKVGIQAAVDASGVTLGPGFKFYLTDNTRYFFVVTDGADYYFEQLTKAI